jgi:Zn-dependent protease with chaperone function
MPPEPRARRVAQTAVVVLGATAATLIWRLTPWTPLPGATGGHARLSAYFTATQIAKSEAFHDAVKWPAWLSLGVGVAVPLVLGTTPLGRRLVSVVTSHTSRWPVQVTALSAAVVALQRLATLPLDAWAESVQVRYGLSTQSWSGWLLDASKSTAVTLVLTTAGLLGLVGLSRRFPATWFVPAGLASAGLVVVASFAYPLVLEPMFNRFTPMADTPLRARLLALAARDGVSVDNVLVADASRRTTALNAYVSGIGASRRIVVYDTLLRSSSPDEVAVVVAHELGHAANSDVVVGTAEGAVAAALGTTVLYLLLQRTAVRQLSGAETAGDPAVVPLVLALATAVAFFALPLENLISRHVEARADAHSLNLTHDPKTFIAVQRQLAVSNLTHLQPNPILSFWFSSHPDPLARIEMALQWKRLHGRAS